MPRHEHKGIHQKQKMLYLVKIFTEETDDSHFLSLAEIIRKLSACGVAADRKTLYNDFVELRDFGYDIIKKKIGRNYFYHIGRRNFELSELKLLTNSVRSDEAITNRKSDELIGKLESLVSKYEAKQLDRQVIIAGRVKTMNESIYCSLDVIHEAINADSQISFKYFRWDINEKMKLHREGEQYEISPWALIRDDENYYLVGYDAKDDMIRHYRVDKMLKISLTDQERQGQKKFRQFSMPRGSHSRFGMFGGEETAVTLEVENRMADVIADRFGRDIRIDPVDEDHFRTTVNAAVSPRFLGWIVSLGSGVRITAPDEAVQQMKDEIRRLSGQYE